MINEIHSPCHLCVNAVFAENKQTDCNMHLLETWREDPDVDLLECDEPDGKEFYVVNGRYCPMFRDQTWLQDKEYNPITVKKQIAEENIIKYAAIIIVDKTIKSSKLMSYFMELKKQKIKPIHTNVILVNEDIKASDAIANLKLVFPDKWSVHTYHEEDLRKAVNDVLFKINKHYMMVVYPSMKGKLKADYSKKFNDLIFKDMKRLGILSFDDGQSFIGQTLLCKSAGDIQESIVSTIKKYDDNNKMVKNISEI